MGDSIWHPRVHLVYFCAPPYKIMKMVLKDPEKPGDSDLIGTILALLLDLEQIANFNKIMLY